MKARAVSTNRTWSRPLDLECVLAAAASGWRCSTALQGVVRICLDCRLSRRLPSSGRQVPEKQHPQTLLLNSHSLFDDSTQNSNECSREGKFLEFHLFWSSSSFRLYSYLTTLRSLGLWTWAAPVAPEKAQDLVH